MLMAVWLHAFLRLDRLAQGGGVAVQIKDNFSSKHITMLDFGNHEIIWLIFNLRAQKVGFWGYILSCPCIRS